MKLKYAQDLIKTNATIASGFNMFIEGYPRPTFGNNSSDVYEKIQGWDYAEKMAKEKGIAFIHNFGCDCGGHSFLYGGFWVCNSCGKKGVDKEWWKIQVEKDGNMFCCHDLNFKNLQESKNYAFGNTFNESIDNYKKLMTYTVNNVKD